MPVLSVPRNIVYSNSNNMYMMMIAFITFNSSLVRLRVYVVQIHGKLSCRVLDGIEPTT